MKTLLAAALCLLALASAPAAEAHVIPPRDVEHCVTVYDFPDAGYAVCYDLEDSDCTVYSYTTTFLGRQKDCIFPDAEASSSPAAVGPPDLSDWPKCVPGVVGQVCVSPYWPGCNIWIAWTAIPAQPTCLYRSDPLATPGSSDVGSPWPGDSTPDLQCMDVYSQTQVPGTNYWLVRRDSCSAQLYECPEGNSPPAPPCREASLLEASPASGTAGLPEVSAPPYCMPYERELEAGPVTVIQGGCGNDVRVCGTSVPRERVVDLSCVLPATTSSASEPNCLQVYRETDLGLVRIVSRDSCHSEHYVCEQEKADVLASRSLDTSQCDTGLAAASSQPAPNTPDPLQRTCYTQGQGELQSRTCVDPDSTDCTVYRQQITGMGSSWVCYPSGESGSDW